MKFLLSWGLLLFLISCSSQKAQTEQKQADIYYRSGTQKLVVGDYKGALKDLRRSYQLDDQSSQTTNNLGMAYLLRGNAQRAQQLIRRAIELDPKNTDALVNLASLYLQEKKFDQAKELYQKVLEDLVYKRQYRTYYNLGIIYEAQKKWHEARSQYQLSIQEEQEYCPAYYRLGLLYKRMNRSKEALETFQKGIKGTCYEKAATVYQLALLEWEMGREKSARERFQDITKRFPEGLFAKKAQQHLDKMSAEVLDPVGKNYFPTQKDKGQGYNRAKSSIETPEF